jgi:hypothetical protein
MKRLSLLALVLLVAGCHPSVRPQGAQGNVGTYRLGTARVKLTDPVRIPTVMAATNAVMRNKGLTVETSRVSDDEGRLVARQPGTASFDRVIVNVQQVPGALEIGITCEPFGDEEMSRSLMDAILYRLGR